MSDIAIIGTLSRGTGGLGTFPVAKQEDLKIPYISVADITARDAIPTWQRIAKMTCYVVSTNLEYTLGTDLTIVGQVWTQKSYGVPANIVTTPMIFDSGGFVQPALIKNIFLNTQYVVSSQAAMLALTTFVGNFVIRTDTSQVFIKLNNTNPAALGDFTVATSPGAVLSVNGLTGAVSITIASLLAVGANQTAFDTAVGNNSTVTGHSSSISTLQSGLATTNTNVTNLTNFVNANLVDRTWQPICLAASFGEQIVIAGGGGESAIDGRSIGAEQFYLLKDQSDPRENGIYLSPTNPGIGAWTRAQSMSYPTQIVHGAFVHVAEDQFGVLQGTNWYIQPLVGTTFSQYPSPLSDVVIVRSFNGFSINAQYALPTAGGLTTILDNNAYSIGLGGLLINHVVLTGNSVKDWTQTGGRDTTMTSLNTHTIGVPSSGGYMTFRKVTGGNGPSSTIYGWGGIALLQFDQSGWQNSATFSGVIRPQSGIQVDQLLTDRVIYGTGVRSGSYSGTTSYVIDVMAEAVSPLPVVGDGWGFRHGHRMSKFWFTTEMQVASITGNGYADYVGKCWDITGATTDFFRVKGVDHSFNPTGAVVFIAGTTTLPPCRFQNGTPLTTPQDGAMEYHSSHLWFTIGSTRYQLDQQSGGGGGGITFPLASSQLVINNPAGTFNYTFTAAAIAASRVITLPLLIASDTMVTANFIQTLTNKTIDNTNTVTTKSTLFTLQDTSDPTKQFRFDLSSIASGGTRTWIVPNSSTTLAGLGITQTWTAPQTFTPTTTLAGMNVGSFAGDPSALNNADMWYNSTLNLLRARVNGVTLSIGNITSTTFNRYTADHTLALTDTGYGTPNTVIVEMNVASGNTVTVPLNSVVPFAIGTQINITQYGTGLTVIASSGATINTSSGNVVVPSRFDIVTLQKVGTDEWYLWNGSGASTSQAMVSTTITSSQTLPAIAYTTYTVFVDCTAGNVTLTVPTANSTLMYIIKRTDNSPNKVLFSGTIDGVSGFFTGGAYMTYLMSLTLTSNGTAWYAN